jgi:hypothetical protein
MSQIPPRTIMQFGVPILDDSVTLFKYMPHLPHLDSVLKNRALHLRRLNEFEDKLEGTTSLAEWDQIQGSASRDWYESGKHHSFVTCFTIADRESDYMWKEYVKAHNGICFRTNVGALRRQFHRSGSDQSGEDVFTLGPVEYFEDKETDIHSEMSLGLSNTRHAFRKRRSYITDQEFRVFLRPGSATAESAFLRKETGVLIPVDRTDLVHEVRLKPGSTKEYRDMMGKLFDSAGITSIPINDSEL